MPWFFLVHSVKLLFRKTLLSVSIDCAGSTSDSVSEFRGLRSVLLGSNAVRHQKDGVGDAVHHGNHWC